ncbi:MAG: cupin fold metalloprotein, WbuC family [Candidatus Schekmanbacteria bacterium]|nr:cupin fold metalloprotein, WbuC family [Candidatus Schekmanbacteria bacterium]
MSAIFLGHADLVSVRQDHISPLLELARRSPLRRARYCFHADHASRVHEMLIAFCGDSFVSPHRHEDKVESFHLVQGELAVVFFADDGTPTGRLDMGPAASGKPFYYRLNRMLWHTVVPLAEIVVLHETTSGPFSPGGTEYAPWGPAESDETGCRIFTKRALAAPPIFPFPAPELLAETAAAAPAEPRRR